MRALLGPLNRVGHAAVLDDLAGLGVVTFDVAGADVAFDPARESLDALWSRLPAGFTPECLIWWSPEYSLVPDGIERCPVPSIAVLGDWNLGFWTTAPLLEAFDRVVTDRMGVRHLAPQLDVPVEYWRAFSFDGRRHWRHLAVERDIDVLFVGNFNHEVQSERAPWLARLARLGARHRVVITTGVFGDEYAALLNRARIVWNRSIRGELNMRAYEAAACGAVLFVEEENLEVRDVFADGESCVLYNDANLEAKLEHYLARPELTAQIADAGWRRVQRETYRAHIARLLRDAEGLRIGRRRFAALPPWRRAYWRGLHALGSPVPGHLAAALSHLVAALSATDDPGTASAALGALAVTVAAGEGDADERQRTLASGIGMLEAALRAHPDDIVTRINLAYAVRAAGDADRARSELVAAREALASGASVPVDRIPAPFGFDRFRVEWERAALTADIGDRAARFAALLSARAAAQLAELEPDPAASTHWWTEAVNAAPGIDGNVRHLAETLEAAGEDAAAAKAYSCAVDGNPFDWGSRLDAARLAAACGDTAILARMIASGSALATAVPGWREAAAGIEALGAAVGEPQARNSG